MSWEPIINIYDPNIKYGDVYVLNYCGILVFFSICDVRTETVKVVELATYPYEDGVMLYRDLRLSKNPFFVNRNVRTKSDYEIKIEEGTEGLLPIYISYESKIINKVDIPMVGIFYAEKINDYKNVYFLNEPEKINA